MNQIAATQDNVFIGILIVTLGIWTMFWKGVALWRAAHYEQKKWFIAFLALILFVNTLGIVELVYLFKFAKKPLTLAEVRSWMGVGLQNPRKKK